MSSSVMATQPRMSHTCRTWFMSVSVLCAVVSLAYYCTDFEWRGSEYWRVADSNWTLIQPLTHTLESCFGSTLCTTG